MSPSYSYGVLDDRHLTRCRFVALCDVQEALRRVGRGLHPDVAIVIASRYLQAEREVTDEQVAEAIKALRRAQEHPPLGLER